MKPGGVLKYILSFSLALIAGVWAGCALFAMFYYAAPPPGAGDPGGFFSDADGLAITVMALASVGAWLVVSLCLAASLIAEALRAPPHLTLWGLVAAGIAISPVVLLNVLEPGAPLFLNAQLFMIFGAGGAVAGIALAALRKRWKRAAA